MHGSWFRVFHGFHVAGCQVGRSRTLTKQQSWVWSLKVYPMTDSHGMMVYLVYIYTYIHKYIYIYTYYMQLYTLTFTINKYNGWNVVWRSERTLRFADSNPSFLEGPS